MPEFELRKWNADARSVEFIVLEKETIQFSFLILICSLKVPFVA